MNTLDMYKIAENEKIDILDYKRFNLYELADYFNVDCKYMIECINFYVEKYGVLI